MSDKSIKLQRTESILRELIPEALSTLNDDMLNGLCVIDVDCTRGKYDATVYLDKMMFDVDEQKYIIKHLKKVNSHIKNHCMQAEGWFRCPDFRFRFDDKLEKQNQMDDLFAQVARELEKGKKDDN
ncbi:MAG TPA: 30S ribosome-binding factor RbfA [Sulfurospirillum arcachonense]|nr:30S ribosome-binding factor RbfA [Sulfurospirillum arcachonense]HIP44904.1 30S ribosome-binding factor RbfA [Sulfurospirillum arcachonense]